MPQTEISTALTPIVVDAAALLVAAGSDDRYGVEALTLAWLQEQRSEHTRRAYKGDLRVYLGWCQESDLNPLTARPTDAGRFRIFLDESAPRSVVRRMSAMSSWYTYLVANGAAEHNPFASAKRPKIDHEETVTVGLTVAEVKAILARADQEALASRGWTPRRHLAALRNRAAIRLLAAMGLRRAEVVSLDLDSLSTNQGYRTLRYRGKGAKMRERAMPAHLLHVLDEYLVVRADFAGESTALFITSTGRGPAGRLDDKNLFDVLRRLATDAGIPSADRVSPHSLRHAFVTNAREMGIALEDVQDAMGHADPRTTRHYDRARRKLSREPALRLGEMYEED